MKQIHVITMLMLGLLVLTPQVALAQYGSSYGSSYSSYPESSYDRSTYGNSYGGIYGANSSGSSSSTGSSYGSSSSGSSSYGSSSSGSSSSGSSGTRVGNFMENAAANNANMGSPGWTPMGVVGNEYNHNPTSYDGFGGSTYRKIGNTWTYGSTPTWELEAREDRRIGMEIANRYDELYGNGQFGLDQTRSSVFWEALKQAEDDLIEWTYFTKRFEWTAPIEPKAFGSQPYYHPITSPSVKAQVNSNPSAALAVRTSQHYTSGLMQVAQGALPGYAKAAPFVSVNAFGPFGCTATKTSGSCGAAGVSIGYDRKTGKVSATYTVSSPLSLGLAPAWSRGLGVSFKPTWLGIQQAQVSETTRIGVQYGWAGNRVTTGIQFTVIK